jgi:hypothetical protein
MLTRHAQGQWILFSPSTVNVPVDRNSTVALSTLAHTGCVIEVPLARDQQYLHLPKWSSYPLLDIDLPTHPASPTIPMVRNLLR